MGTLPPLSLLTPNQPTPQASDPPNDGSQSLNTPTPAFPVPANGLSLKTPKSRRVLIHPTPKTPTPLKNALKEIERKIEALKQMVSERVFFLIGNFLLVTLLLLNLSRQRHISSFSFQPQSHNHFDDIVEIIRKETEVDKSKYQTPSLLSNDSYNRVSNDYS